MWHQWFNHNFMKLWEYFLCTKKTKIMTLFNAFFSFGTVLCHYRRMRFALFRCRGTQCACVYNGGGLSPKRRNRWIIVVFFAHKKYSRNFVKLWLNHWCHILTTSLLHFRALIVVVPLLSMEGQRTLGIHKKYLNLCFEDEQRSYGFGKTWRRVINDRIIIFGWTNPSFTLIYHITEVI